MKLFPYIDNLSIAEQINKASELADRIHHLALELDEVTDCLSCAHLTTQEQDQVFENVVPMLDQIGMVEINTDLI